MTGGHQERIREANQLMQPIKLPPTPPPKLSLSKHFKVLPSANGNKVNELAVNGLRCWGCWGRGLSNDAHHTEKTVFPCCKSKMGVQHLPGRGNTKSDEIQQLIQRMDIFVDGQWGRWLCLWVLWNESYIINALCQNVLEERAISQQELWNDTLSWRRAWRLNLRKYSGGVFLWNGG